ncbi:MAG: tRNA pseudouridine(55) synthase TruB, partial [Leptonema sp. (in: Bacteria)]|nr:tRNA pseudouridine(55) synthase TruB [Leptonema sp. (in: bacteria)]
MIANDDGIVLAYKPPGLGSARLVSRLKRLTNCKVGHTGTLDRFAEGLMILLVGRATVFSDFFLKLDKSYLATLKFGVSTNTIDPNGDIIEKWPESKLTSFLENSQVQITEAIQNRIHQKEQIPPDFAAIKQGGIRLSDRSRKGLPIEVRPRSVRFYEAYRVFDDTEKCQPTVKAFFSVSSGTYIRSAIRDIGQDLGAPVHLDQLCRQSVGGFSIDDKIVWHNLDEKPQLISILSVFANWPKRIVSV